MPDIKIVMVLSIALVDLSSLPIVSACELFGGGDCIIVAVCGASEISIVTGLSSVLNNFKISFNSSMDILSSSSSRSTNFGALFEVNEIVILIVVESIVVVSFLVELT